MSSYPDPRLTCKNSVGACYLTVINVNVHHECMPKWDRFSIHLPLISCFFFPFDVL